MSIVPKKRPKSARHRTREFILQGLYAWLLDPREAAHIDSDLRIADGFSKSDVAYFDILLPGIISGYKTLGETLSPYLDRSLAELSPVEQAALLIGTYELIHCLDIPYRVIINEAVELTKTFGSSEGYKFVNGVLDKLAMTLRNTEITHKS
mgnify:CR=1 FL=1